MIIPFGYPQIDKNEKKAVMKVLSQPILAHGVNTKNFETKFQKFTNSKIAISVSSCTAGMHLFYESIGLKKNDEVIIPAQTHVATAHAVELTGAKPVFVDCELDTGNIDIDKIESKISNRTKVITVVHFIGIPVNMQKIMKIAKKYNLFVLEDCALSLGAKIKNKHTGLYGDAGVFSFYPVKHITTGEGGMIISKTQKLKNILNLKKSLGVNKSFSERKIPGMYECVDVGFNYRMSEVNSVIGSEQMKKLNSFLNKRKKNFKYLKQKISKIKSLKILESNDPNLQSSNYCLTIILNNSLLKKRNSIIKILKSKGIGTSVYYPQPVPRMRYYKKKYGYLSKSFKKTEIISDCSIGLSVGPHLFKKKIDLVSKTLIDIINKEIKK